MYGSSHARIIHGGYGSMQHRAAYTPGYNPAGGFFSGLKKLAKKVQTVATKTIVGKALTAFVPGASTAVAGLSAANKVMGGLGVGKKAVKAGGPQIIGTTTKKKRRKRRATGRTRRSAYSRGDYGDDWVGNKPSFTKHGHKFLTRAGGRHHKKHRRGGRRGGGRVSFTTKDGRHVSFTPGGGRRKRRSRSRRSSSSSRSRRSTSSSSSRGAGGSSDMWKGGGGKFSGHGASGTWDAPGPSAGERLQAELKSLNTSADEVIDAIRNAPISRGAQW